MRVKRFVADSMQEAIALVKADFGKEAVILHTKRVRKGGIFGLFGRTKVEVVAATEGKPPRRAAAKEPAPNAGPIAMAGAAEAAAGSELARVREELDQIKRALQAKADPYGDQPEPIRWARQRLIDSDVHEDLVQELLEAIESRARKDQLHDAGWVERAVREELISGLVCADPWKMADSAKIQCLVGPTGVGKTTTIAKLAANYSLLAGKRVALVTVDTYRIAAVEQLKTYAEIIGIPVDVAFTPQELKEAVAARALEYDMILVDTAGRSHKNKMQMAELRAFLEALDDPQIHLVLSATTRQQDMLDIVEHFSRLPVSGLIVTKLDETGTYGLLYNACRLTGKPLSYLTNGQSVPDDIEVAEAERVAGLILG